jgi:hypothetical protein
MRILYLILLLAAATAFDGVVTTRLAIGAVLPDAFLVVALVWLSLQRGPWALAGAVTVGLACDLSVASRLGAVTMVLATAGAVWAWFDDLWPSSRLRRLALLTTLALAIPLALAVTLKLTGNVTLDWPVVCSRALAVGGYSWVLSLPLALAIRWCGEMLGGERGYLGYLSDHRDTTF